MHGFLLLTVGLQRKYITDSKIINDIIIINYVLQG